MNDISSVESSLIDALSKRLHAAASVLGRLAEKDGRVAELMRLRAVLERIAAMGGEAGEEARRALGW